MSNIGPDMTRTIEDRLRALEDERSILQTMYQYAHALDYGWTEAFLDCFIEDGAWEAPQVGRFEGQTRLGKFFAWHTHAPGKYHKHLLIEPRVILSADEATVESYWVRLDEEPAGPYIWAFGRYRDRLVRCGDGAWRFAERRIEREGLRPSAIPFKGPDD